jgi:hypothetical protein
MVIPYQDPNSIRTQLRRLSVDTLDRRILTQDRHIAAAQLQRSA